MKIRNLTPDDVPAVIELWKSAGLEFRPEGRDAPGALADFFLGNRDLCLGAEVAGALAGAALGSDDGRKGWINRIAVAPAHRGKGIAGELVRSLEAALGARGRRVIAATIFRDNAASIGLFEKSGFAPLEDVVYYRKARSEGD